MSYFVKPGSVVRQIWGNPDTILFIFAGASAEFALNKAVDWLYFTGKLPADPIGRLFSTVEYARKIVFSEQQDALNAVDQITAIHKKVEANRGMSIPEWAYRDVLYMLIDYSMRSFELLERKLTADEREELFMVFNAVGLRMGITGLPGNYEEWQESRTYHLNRDLACSGFTQDLYKQYRKHLGAVRYALLKQVQILLVPQEVAKLLPFNKLRILDPLIGAYKVFRFFSLDDIMKKIILPEKYKDQILALKAS
ncbi:MAG TPA: oxygenase MpaB family protein [Daejeonella sp.]